jgi:hypothetical protein
MLKKDRVTTLDKDEYLKSFTEEEYRREHLLRARRPIGQPKPRTLEWMLSLPLQGMQGKRITQMFM